MVTARLPSFSLSLLIAFALPCLESRSAIAAGPSKADRNAQPAVIDASQYTDLQAAFDAVPEAGGLVRLPPGNFMLTTPLVLTRGNTRVEGAGPATQLINCNREGQPALIVRPADRAKNRGTRIWRVQLANFRINGDPDTVDAKSTSPKSGDGLLAEGVNEIYIHGMSIDHNGGHGIHLIDCYEDPRIADSIITYNARAGLNIVSSHDIVVSANQLEENQDAVRCIDSFNLCMNGNNLDDHLRHGVVIENTYGSVLSGNMIEECRGTAVIMDRDCYGNTVSANVLAHNFAGGVDLRDAWGCAVSANTLTMDTPFGVRVGPDAGRITIAANNFSNAYIGGKNKREDAAGGVLLEQTSDVTVAGNVFTGLMRQAVKADARCRRIMINGNLMGDLNRAGTDKRPALDLGDAKDVVIGKNVCQDSPPADQ